MCAGLLTLPLLLAGCGQGDSQTEPPEDLFSGPAKEELKVFVASDPSEYMEEVERDMNHLVIPLLFYSLHTGTVPTTEEGLRALMSPPADPAVRAKWRGEYLPSDLPDIDQVFIDPWGHPYVYRKLEGGKEQFELFSLRPDGVESDDDISYKDFEVGKLFNSKSSATAEKPAEATSPGG